MISPENFYRHLSTRGINFFTGVPDSILKNFLFFLAGHVDDSNHCIAANEGHAIALATGYHLSSGKLPLVYMQNSGLGNAINPLTSLSDKEVYSIPMLLLIGWRGGPGKKDEPQHRKMGRITEEILQLLQVPHFILQPDEALTYALLDKAIETAVELQQPVALLVPADIFSIFSKPVSENSFTLSRESVINALLPNFNQDDIVVCTTGKTAREFDELNKQSERRIKQFLCVGAMGLASQVALGINMNFKGRTIVLDGDGALLMHLGTMPVIAGKSRGVYIHILLNSGSHESVGGHPTVGFSVDFPAIAKACGYDQTHIVSNAEELGMWIENNFTNPGIQFLEIRIREGSRINLSRPSGTPREWKEELMNQLVPKL